MPTLITCPSCSRQLRVPDELLGRRVKCPSCGETFTAATDEPAPPAPAPPPPVPPPPAPPINERGEIVRDESPEPPRESIRPEPAGPRDRYDREEEDEPYGRPRRRREDDEPYGRPRRGRDDDNYDRPRRSRYRDDFDEDHPFRDRRSEARGKVAGPAIALMITGGLAIALVLLSAGLIAFGLTAGGPQPPQEELVPQLIGNAIGLGLGLLWGLLLIVGGMKMRKLESYALSMTASIVAMLPCTSCCLLGLPFGIWALVVLGQSDVKESFR
jgi:predicted Zn finger-like uncharacterized protein